MWSEEEIIEIMRTGEHINLECKEAGNAIPNDVWETYSAFANTYGGIILLGVRENLKEKNPKKRFILTGVNNPSQRMKDFWDSVNNNEKVNRNLLIDQDVKPVQFKDGPCIIVIHVPAADYSEKPVFINKNPYFGTYRRNFEGDYHCKEEEEVKSMIRDSSDEPSDSLLLQNYGMEDVDLDTLHAYRNLFEVRNRGHIYNTYSDLEFLRQLGGYVKDRKTGDEGLSIAGLLMFGKGLSIRERFPLLAMDYLDQRGAATDQRWTDRITLDGSWENNLFNFVQKVLSKMTEDLKKPFMMEGITRIDESPVHQAVREALINMVIHADYRTGGQLKVVRSSDGFLLSNPGNLKLPVIGIYSGGRTAARNPKLQTMFRMIGFCENIGSGFPVILEAWKSNGWRRPDLKDRLKLHCVELELSMIDQIPQQTLEKLENQFGSKVYNLTELEKIALVEIAAEERVSKFSLYQTLNVERG